ncbi:hypothetical protein Nepgr_011828 [Nepenthes gracilis]|uniref:Uncharacterized protein n=1 Tax=Nepenthes gracilis TaxID=150966 RepID=A0AAD3XMA5_NEPGR|nr:hypothetical protein Nepgr_011828 [Nepenthes gracilis]
MAWATAAASAGVLLSNSMAYTSKSLSSISNHSFKPQLSFTPSMASAKPSILTFLGLCYVVDLMPPDVASSLGQ